MSRAVDELARDAGPAGESNLLARAWHLPLGVHVVALGVVLLVSLIAAGPRVAYSSDEGAAILQAHLLREGNGWLYRYPLANLDPADQARPFVRGDAGTKGIAPYAKHPLYPLVLAGLDLIGGQLVVLVGTALGALLAAWLAAVAVRALDPRLDRVTLWLVGVGSPLFFDASFVLAHTLAAAAVAAGVVFALGALRSGRSRFRRAVLLGAMFASWVVASMLRTEALFIGPAFAAGAVGLVLVERLPWRRAGLAATAAAGASAVAWASDKLAAHAIIGTALPVPPNTSPPSWLAGRWQAFDTTWLKPSYGAGGLGDLALVLGVVMLVVAAYLLRRRQSSAGAIQVVMMLAGVAYLVRLVVGPAGAIPGLAVAFPAGWFLLWSTGARATRGVVAPVLALTAGLTTAAVLVTEYAIGGGVEWGGRYFAIVIPVATPLLVYAAEPVIRRHGHEVARLVVGVLAVISLATAVMAVQALRHEHEQTAAALDGIRVAATEAGTAGGLDRPVVVSTNRLLPQIDYRDFDRYDWVVADHLGPYGQRLAARGVEQVVLVSSDLAADLKELPGWTVERRVSDPLDVVVLRHTG